MRSHRKHNVGLKIPLDDKNVSELLYEKQMHAQKNVPFHNPSSAASAQDELAIHFVLYQHFLKVDSMV